MKVAIFDIGQTLVLNQEPYDVYVRHQVLKISKVIIQNLLESEFAQILNLE